MGKLPQVTVGRATGGGGSAPTATLGRATGEGLPPLPSANAEELQDRLGGPLATRQLTLSDIVEQNETAAPVLLIHELTGTESRQVVLGGRALPFKGSLKFTGEMGIESSKYPGYPRVNQTVTGGNEGETEMNGEWHDRYLSDPDAVSAVLRRAVRSTEDGVIASRRTELTSARELCDLFDDMRLAARPCRVSWAHIVRIGRIAIFEQDWQNLHDVKWKLKFEWIGQDDAGLALPSPPRTTLVEVARAISTGYRDLHDATNFDDLDLEPRFADQIDGLVGAAQATVEELASAVENRVASVTDSIDGVRRAASLAALARDQAQDVVDSLNDTVASAMLTATTVRDIGVTTSGVTSGQISITDLTGIDPGDAVAAACQQFGAIRAARALKHLAARQRWRILRAHENDVIAIVTMRDGEDLRDVAKRWYGSPDDWDEIRRFNGLESSSPGSGTLVFVPTPRAP